MRSLEIVSGMDGNLYEVQVSADGSTLWVNGPDGSAVGRFSKRFGIDVHRSGTEQMEGMGECLFCTHVAPGRHQWTQFLDAMQEHYGLGIESSWITFEGLPETSET